MNLLPGLLGGLFWALAAPAGAAEGPSFGAGTSFAAGTGSYWRVGLLGDVEWRIQPWSPYGWTEVAWDRYASRLAFGGGAWRELDEDLRVKGGLSYAVGRFRDSDDGSRAVTLETGVERAFPNGAAGAEYQFTSGGLGPRGQASVSKNRGGQVRSSQRGGPTYTFTDHYLAVYGRLPAGEKTVGLRAAVDFPSDSETVLSQTASLRLPVAASTWLTPAFTLEEGRDVAAILALTLYRLFD